MSIDDGIHEICSRCGVVRPCIAHEGWPAPLPTSSSSVQQALDALAFAHGAIGDAIGLDEGLDGVAGQKVLEMIDAALRANGRLPPDVPPEDHAVAPTPYWTASIEPASSSAWEPVTRFEVIQDGIGRVWSHRECSIELSYQDDGKTLKVFVSARPSPCICDPSKGIYCALHYPRVLPDPLNPPPPSEQR